MAELTNEQKVALDHARHLAENGAPIFVARPNNSPLGFRLPDEWQQTKPDPSVVDKWRPGWALGLVTGVLVDVIDIDPRNGGDRAALNGTMPTSYGRADTPSGGSHDLVASLGVPKGKPYPGVDVQAGDANGDGRGFVFLAPTERPSKVTGEVHPYTWVAPPNVDVLALVGSDGSGEALAEVMRSQHAAPAQREPVDPSTPPTARELEKAATLLDKAVAEMSEAREGTRNDLLIRLLPNLYRFALGGCLDPVVVDERMLEAAVRAGLLADEYKAVARNALAYAEDDGPDRPEVEEADQVFTPVPLPDTNRIPVGNFVDPREGLLADVLARRVGKYVQVALGELDERFYVYNGGVWQPGARQIGTVVSLSLGNAYRKAHLGTVQDKIRFDPATPTLDCGPTPKWINCRNGLLDWRTGRLSDHTPDVLSVTQLPVVWNPGAECPQFERFLRQVLPADCIEPMAGGPGFIWELLGYFLYSGNPHHIAVLLRGKGRNGKGVLLRVLERLLGTQNVSSVTLHDLSDNRFRAASLYGKIANIAGDLDPKWLANTATFKAITGGDSISAEHKYGAAFNFTPWAVPIYSANKVFGSADSSEGYFARWVVVPFPNSFLGREDRHLDARLGTRDELEGVLRRAAEALPVLMQRGRLPEPESVKAAKHEFIVGGDRVRAWIDEGWELDAEGWTPRSDLFADFSLGDDFDSKKPMSRREFYNRLEGIDGVWPAKRRGVDGFRGIRRKAGGAS